MDESVCRKNTFFFNGIKLNLDKLWEFCILLHNIPSFLCLNMLLLNQMILQDDRLYLCHRLVNALAQHDAHCE